MSLFWYCFQSFRCLRDQVPSREGDWFLIELRWCERQKGPPFVNYNGPFRNFAVLPFAVHTKNGKRARRSAVITARSENLPFSRLPFTPTQGFIGFYRFFLDFGGKILTCGVWFAHFGSSSDSE